MKKPVVVCSANQKGGVCKTTSLVILARGLASKGKKVLVVDLDAQRGNISRALGADTSNVQGVYELLMDAQGVPAIDTVQEVSDGLFVIEADENIAGFELVNDMNKQFILDDRLHELLEDASAPDFDYVFIDTPPKHVTFTASALAASDYVLIPCVPQKASIDGVAAIYRDCKAATRRMNPNLKILGVAVMMQDAQAANIQKENVEVIESWAGQVGLDVFDSVIPRSRLIQEAIDLREDWTEYSVENKRNKAIVDCWRFVDEFEKKVAGE